MAIQKLIDNATTIDINRQASVSTTRSRVGTLKYAKGLVNPYRFSVSVHDGLSYADNRELPAQIDQMDRVFAERFKLSNNTGMNYLTAYKGDATASDIGKIIINSTSGANIYMDTSAMTSANSSLNLFEKGDYIQPKGILNLRVHRVNPTLGIGGVALRFRASSTSTAEITIVQYLRKQIEDHGLLKIRFPAAGDITSSQGWDTALGSNVYYINNTTFGSEEYFDMFEDSAGTTRYNPATPTVNEFITATVEVTMQNCYDYPYTVVEDVSYTANSNVTVKVHRGILDQNEYEVGYAEQTVTLANSEIKVGNDVTFLTKFVKKPTCTIVPSRNLVIDDFELVEDLNKFPNGN